MLKPLAAVAVVGLLALGVYLGTSTARRDAERIGILAPFDLAAGQYVIVVSLGEPALRQHPRAPLVRVIDDQALIARHRNGLDVRTGMTDFLFGEGRPTDIYLYVYRDGTRLAGQRVTQRERVSVPDALLAASRVARLQTLVADEAALEAQRIALRQRHALITDEPTGTLNWVDLEENVAVTRPGAPPPLPGVITTGR